MVKHPFDHGHYTMVIHNSETRAAAALTQRRWDHQQGFRLSYPGYGRPTGMKGVAGFK
jgi:hypothetical protein